MTFAEILRSLLKEQGISKAKFSRDTKIAPTTIDGWLYAGRLPDYHSIRKICLYFHISADELLQLK